MPELPDLEAIKEVLNRTVAGARIVRISVLRPLVLRSLTMETPDAFCVPREIRAIDRQGKFLLFELGPGRWIVFSFMLAGRLRFCAPDERTLVRDYVSFDLSNGSHLRYHDPEGMGKIYLTEELGAVPGYADMGPDALDDELTLEAFMQRLGRFRGEVKGVLTRGAFVAGIGNAYADEILFAAGLYPFRKSTSLSAEERTALYRAMRQVLQQATRTVRERMGDEIQLEIRDFLQVHNKRGEACPRCGQSLSEIKVRKRATTFCRHCQPGMLLRG
ncbi:MAG: Fpg/Nei family DNA glycosylase [Anaerolineae bacterium]|nr:Fpg/Nei family DNA glycosylase [Anaerolineae bacterium]